MLATLGALTNRQTRVWRDEEQLLRHAVDVTHDNWFARGYLGSILLRQGRQEEASVHLEEAFRIEPDFLETARSLAELRRRQGRHAEAAALDRRIVLNLPWDAGARHALGRDLEGLGRTAEALREYKKATRLDPKFAAPRIALGRILLAGGRRDEGCACFADALRSEPGGPEAMGLLATSCR